MNKLSKQQQAFNGFNMFAVGNKDTFSCGAIDSLLPPDPDVPDMSLSTNIETNKKDVPILDYELNLNEDELIEDSTKTASAKKFQKGTGPPPRPQNAFILYRKNKNADPKFKRIEAKFNSKEIAKLWKEEPEKVKEVFNEFAKKAKELHSIKYKGYQYKRKPPKNKKKTKKTVVNRNTSDSSLKFEDQSPQHTSNDTPHSPQQYTSSEIDMSLSPVTPSPPMIQSPQQYMSNDVLQFSTDSIESNLVAELYNTQQYTSSGLQLDEINASFSPVALSDNNNSYLQCMSDRALQLPDESTSSVFDLSEFYQLDNTQGLIILDQQSFIQGSFSPDISLPLTLENNSYLQYMGNCAFLPSTDSYEYPPIFDLSGLYQNDPVPLDQIYSNFLNTDTTNDTQSFDHYLSYQPFSIKSHNNKVSQKSAKNML